VTDHQEVAHAGRSISQIQQGMETDRLGEQIVEIFLKRLA
jgi:hypothetical protein